MKIHCNVLISINESFMQVLRFSVLIVSLYGVLICSLSEQEVMVKCVTGSVMSQGKQEIC